MDFMSMFRQGPQAPAPTATPSPVPTGNPNDPNNSNLPDPNATADADKNKNKSPMDEFSGLWDTPTPKEGEEPQPDWNDPLSIVPKMQVDPKKMMEVAQRINFAQIMPREKVEAALKGDSQAFSDVINLVAQSVYANMAHSTSRIGEAMLKQMAPKLFEALPAHIRKHIVSDTVAGDNPIFQNPAAAPMLKSLEAQFQLKYPKASAKEISDMAKKYLGNFADLIKGTKQKGAGGAADLDPNNPLRKTGGATDDWSDYFTTNQQAQ